VGTQAHGDPPTRRWAARAEVRGRLDREHEPRGRCGRCLVEDPAAVVRREAHVHRHLVRRAKAVGVGSLFALAPGKGIVAHREANGVLHTYVALTKPQEWIAGIDFANPKAAKAAVAAEFDGWAPELTALITDSESDPIPRAIHALPAGQRWKRMPGVTLLGDAAHLMPPDGEGANLAMYDGAELGTAIAAHRGDLETALAEYEETMFVRSANAAVEAAQTFALCFADDNAPHGLIDFLTRPAPTSTSEEPSP
jgi:2-polyprenyl-6-methoxyphenol hydroxylase-like FAD-dependent oxidoreductase